jgi:hypothetical protein
MRYIFGTLTVQISSVENFSLYSNRYMRSCDIFGNVSELHNQKNSRQIFPASKVLTEYLSISMCTIYPRMRSKYENSEWRLSVVGIRASPSRVNEVTGKSLALAISTTKGFVYLMKEKKNTFSCTRRFSSAN